MSMSTQDVERASSMRAWEPAQGYLSCDGVLHLVMGQV